MKKMILSLLLVSGVVVADNGNGWNWYCSCLDGIGNAADMIALFSAVYYGPEDVKTKTIEDASRKTKVAALVCHQSNHTVKKMKEFVASGQDAEKDQDAVQQG